MRRTRPLVLVLSMGLAAPALAQAPPPLELTVEEAVGRALASAPRIDEARAQEAAADAALAARVAERRPLLTLGAGMLRTNHVEEFGIPLAGGGTRVIFPDLPDNYRARAELSVPIYTGGRTAALVDAAGADRRAADAERAAASATVRLDVVMAYWTLVTARERVAVLERAVERAGAMLADVEAGVRAGLLPPNESLSARAQQARQRVRLVEARSADALAAMQLARLAGVPLDQRIEPVTPVGQPDPVAAEMAARPVDQIVVAAWEARPERRALEARRRSLEATAEAARAAARPRVSALAAVEPARPNPRFVPRVDRWNTSWDLGVNVTWSLWDGGRARADRAGVLARAEALDRRLDDVDALIAVEVRERLLDLETAHAALAAATDAVDAATEAARVVDARFAAGVATSTDRLEAEVARLEAELDHTRLSAAVRVSEARLLRTSGVE